MTPLKVFNPETLLHYTENDAEFASQLVSMGKSDIPAFLEKAERLYEKKHYNDASRAIHSLKGVAGALGAERLFNHSLNCEILLKEAQDLDEAAQLLKLIHSDIESLFTDPAFLRFSDDRTV